MKARLIGYWVVTVLVALAFLAGGAGDISKGPDMLAGMAHLGYPAYLLVFLGAWKIAGGLAILAPGTPQLKEWAYAGMIFDLTGAAYSHAASGDPAKNVITPLLIAALAMASWALRPAGRTLKVLGSNTAADLKTASKPVAA
ncbi:MAG: DoxX family protein [Minicystis sp.]